MDSYVTLCILYLHCVLLYAKTPYHIVIFTKIYTNYCTHFPIACMNYNYVLLVWCALFAWGVSVTRRVNVVVVNSRCMIFHQETFSFTCLYWYKREKCILGPIVTDSLHKNPGVGTMVPKNAISHVGVFFLIDSELCAISMCKSQCKHNSLCKGKCDLISIL